MKKATWRKHHKWLGIGMSFFMLMFCLSGVLLNHRSLIRDVNVSRRWLPSRYEFRQWNGGLLRGTLNLDHAGPQDFLADTCRLHHLLLYGNGGMWLTDSKASRFVDYNEGLPAGADYRQIRNVVSTARGSLFAVSPFALYRREGHTAWHTAALPLHAGERLTDIARHGDTLVVLGRSFVYTSLPPYTTFTRLQLQAPAGYDGRVTAFRTVWMLHSGELFGLAGRLVVDAIAVVFVVLCVTGLVFWRRPRRRGWLQTSLRLHDRTGRYTIAVTLLIALTGWCLRPPAMIPLALSKMPALPFTTLRSPNPWNDKLRMISYDEACHDWLLSTSEGFYSLRLADATATALPSAPPVSVMGLNVLQQDARGRWLCGSFSGLYVWDRHHHSATDYFTDEPAPRKAGAPFGKRAIAGMSQDFDTPAIADYYEGTAFCQQPAGMNQLPMSLWNVALELHSGRLFIGSIATYVFVFVMGALALWCLWSGYRIRLRKK